ncbi:RmlC-like cupin domain-containing protein [Powellomyces hirtus]|nr:RmlC-like cupin domain-containing protein [Powellomyces hirtus]
MPKPQLPSVEELITCLHLQSHPEGGWFAESNRTPADPTTGTATRDLTTSIYFPMYSDPTHPERARSSLHRLGHTSETFYLHPSTASATLLEIDMEQGGRGEAPSARLVHLGSDVARGEVSQYMFRAGVRFGGVTDAAEGEYTLVGCNCAPGFDEDDFQMIKDHPEVPETLSKTFRDDKAVWDVLSRLL